MPPKPKGNGQKTNKKKKGNKPNSSATRAPSANAPTGVFDGAIPDMSGFERRNPINPDDYPTVYQRYKDATKRFFAYMKKQATARGVITAESELSVNTLVTIVDEMHDAGHTMDPLALRDLKMSIRIRSRVAKSVFGGGDSGHQHLLTVLIYCWTILVNLPKEPTHDYEAPKSMNSQEVNRFDVFQADLEDEELDENDEECFPSSVPRPEPLPDQCLEDLMNSDERHDAILFLLSLEELMEVVSRQYQYVSENYRLNVALEIPPSNIVENLIRASVATSMCIQQVQRFDAELTLQYPHLSTPYRLLATVILPGVIDMVSSVLLEHSSKKTELRDAQVFLGDCLECSFRHPLDPCSRFEFILPEFCKRYKVDSRGTEELQHIMEAIQYYVMFEVPLRPDERQRNAVLSLNISNDDPSDLFGEPHEWLNDLQNIGGGRSIHHTIRLLQHFGYAIKRAPVDHVCNVHQGSFGPTPWVQGRSSKIAGDMDELLMADILPQISTMFRFGILGLVELPMVNEIAPLWLNLRKYIKHPEKAVTWSLAFSAHAMLTAILETDNFTDSLMSLSESAFQKFFKQVEWAKNISDGGQDSFAQGPSFCRNIEVVCSLKNLGLPVDATRAIWNPLYAGTIFAYLTYAGNMERGCLLVDDRAQLRMVMYLYHGLLLNGIVESGRIPFLDSIFASFKKSRALWGGELPRRGELVQRFLTSFGMNPIDATDLSQIAREMYEPGSCLDVSNDGVGRSLTLRNRRMNRPLPEEISRSYRRVCNNDFHAIEDKYHTQELRDQGKRADHYLLVVRMNDIMDAIDEEQQLLSLNLISCAAILEQFVGGLSQTMNWDPIINSEFIIDHRIGSIYMLAHHLLGALDFSSDPMDHKFLQVPLGRTSSTLLESYFKQVNVENVSWYIDSYSNELKGAPSLKALSCRNHSLGRQFIPD